MKILYYLRIEIETRDTLLELSFNITFTTRIRLQG